MLRVAVFTSVTLLYNVGEILTFEAPIIDFGKGFMLLSVSRLASCLFARNTECANQNSEVAMPPKVPQWNPPGGGQQGCIPRGRHGSGFKGSLLRQKASAGKQGLKKIGLQKPHFSETELSFCKPKN